MTAQRWFPASRSMALLALLVVGPFSAAMGQATDSMHAHRDGMKMPGMMGGAHHVLAMAYRDNLATFARALDAHARAAATIDLDLARPAVTEMRRSLDLIRQHHQAQMDAMGSRAKGADSAMMERMAAHLTALGEHLAALEAEVNGATPTAAKVADHTGAILKECDGMAPMSAKPMNR